MASSRAPASTSEFPFFRLLVLTGAIFVSVSSEFLPTGLLPDMARDLAVAESQIGLLITIFAGTVVLSTAPLTILTRRFSRKRLIVVLLLVFAIANGLCAVAPNYEFLVGARVLGGLAHGLFWAVVGPYAARLVQRKDLAKAVSVTNAGGTAAFVLGVPLGTALGHALGWRLAFLLMGVLVLVLTALVIVLLPPVSREVPLYTGEIALPLRQDRTMPLVLIVCLTVLFVITGHNIFYTYLAPWAIQAAAFPPGAVSGLLLLYGAAGIIGLVVAGILGDRHPRHLIPVLVGGVIVSVSVMAVFGTSQGVAIAGIIGWSAFFGGLPALFNARVLQVVSSRGRDVAAALMTTSFNVAIGGGALIGGVLLDTAGISSLPYTLVGVVALGLVILLISDRWMPYRRIR